MRFEGEVRDYKRAIARQVEAKVLAGERLTLAEVDAVPGAPVRPRARLARGSVVVVGGV